MGLIIDLEDEINRIEDGVGNSENHADIAPRMSRWKGFKEAIMIPGVLSYGFAFFCVKFCVYCIMFWMPMFLKELHNYDEH
jgi:sugar phosphate permease